jgi:7-carboxy-7-deazaguanine synthase
VTYAVKEMFFTLQGEGANVGRPAVFCRFAGCNLWSGLERDRATAACRFCDTDFRGTDGLGGGRFSEADDLANAVAARWPRTSSSRIRPLVVCTGGEPLLQLDEGLIGSLHRHGFEVAVETNGTQSAPQSLDWICVSPKANTELVLRRGNELKLVYPQTEPEAQPAQFEHLDFEHFFLQPMDGPDREANTARAVQFCMEHPQWRLSLQVHKQLGIR